MNFKILEYIVAIAETGSVTKAAERLFISQSGLNQQLIKLEAELGTPSLSPLQKRNAPDSCRAHLYRKRKTNFKDGTELRQPDQRSV
ncbi:MAG: LysR family transcriptional regulator [Lachnospiraceae bacterium]